MDQDRYTEASTCCIDSTGTGIDPSTVCNTIPAGSVSCTDSDTACMLSKIYFPNQTYKAGFAPTTALCNGTLFPELVRIFK